MGVNPPVSSRIDFSPPALSEASILPSPPAGGAGDERCVVLFSSLLSTDYFLAQRRVRAPRPLLPTFNSRLSRATLEIVNLSVTQPDGSTSISATQTKTDRSPPTVQRRDRVSGPCSRRPDRRRTPRPTTARFKLTPSKPTQPSPTSFSRAPFTTPRTPS